jgi:hypothetical protein
VTCDRTRDLFSALVDDALSTEERLSLEAHLAGCPDCRRELEAFRRTVALMRSAAPVRAPAGFVNRVLAAARPVPWYRRVARRLFLPLRVKLPMEAAAVGIVAITGVILYRETAELQRAARPETSRPPVVSGTPQSPAPPPAARSAPAEPARRRFEDAPRESAPDRRAETDELRSAEKKDLLKQKRETSSGSPSSELAAANVAGRLAVTDRTSAEGALSDLVSRLGGVVLTRRSEVDATVVDIRVPRARYAELIQGLAAIGRWVPEHEVGELPDDVHVSLRLTV